MSKVAQCTWFGLCPWLVLACSGGGASPSGAGQMADSAQAGVVAPTMARPVTAGDKAASSSASGGNAARAVNAPAAGSGGSVASPGSAAAVGGAGAGAPIAAAAGSSGGATPPSNASGDCNQPGSELEKAVCAANDFLAKLTPAESMAVKVDFTDKVKRTTWSNLPNVDRSGMMMGMLSADAQQAALGMMQSVLSESGMSDLNGLRAADDYLAMQSGGAILGLFGSGKYSVAVVGTPSLTADWAIMFGGHHLAYNLTFLAGRTFPMPSHLGVEPKMPFMINGASYEPLSDESQTLAAVFESLSDAERSSAYLAGQSFADVLVGPVEYQTGDIDAVTSKYPTGSNRKGLSVATLSDAQRALVKAAIEAWVGDYTKSVADALLSEYTSSEAFADTLLVWAGNQSAGVDVDVEGTYARIDGPRVWIELVCQAAINFPGQTHFHAMFRDKMNDYGGSL